MYQLTRPSPRPELGSMPTWIHQALGTGPQQRCWPGRKGAAAEEAGCHPWLAQGWEKPSCCRTLAALCSRDAESLKDGFSIYQLPRDSKSALRNSVSLERVQILWAQVCQGNKGGTGKGKEIGANTRGETDIRYLEKAAQLLGKQETLDVFQSRDGGGAGKLTQYLQGLPRTTNGTVSASCGALVRL